MGYDASFYIPKSKISAYKTEMAKNTVLESATVGDEWSAKAFEEDGDVYWSGSAIKELIDVLADRGIEQTSEWDGNDDDDENADYIEQSAFYVAPSQLVVLGTLASRFISLVPISDAISISRLGDEDTAWQVVNDWRRGVVSRKVIRTEQAIVSGARASVGNIVVDRDREYFHSETLSERMKKNEMKAESDGDGDWKDASPKVNSIGFDKRPTVNVGDVAIDYSNTGYPVTTEEETIDPQARAVNGRRIFKCFYDAGIDYDLPEFCDFIFTDIRCAIDIMQMLGMIGKTAEVAGVESIRVIAGY